MSSDEKYVRAPEFCNDSGDSDVSFGEWLPSEPDGLTVEDNNDSCSLETSLEDALENDVGDKEQMENDANRTHGVEKSVDELRNENLEYARRIEQLENTLNRYIKDMSSPQPHGTVGSTPREIDESWNTGGEVAGPSTSTGSIRWENIQPFPDDTPANMMWEQWNRFIDRFEIAVSISNVNDPVKRSQILFLSMGEKLQGKKREDLRRGARECCVKPGDKVVVERQVRAKAESRFDSP